MGQRQGSTRNYCCSSFRVASMDEDKTQPTRHYYNILKWYVQTTSPFVRIKKWHVLMRQELWPQCSKNQLQNSNKNKKILKSNSPIKIVTFCVRTLKRIGQLPEQTVSVIDLNKGMICEQVWLCLQVLKSLNRIEEIKPRMMVATFNGDPSTTIVSCYSPNKFSDEMDLIVF